MRPRDTVIVLNRRFVPDRPGSPYLYGVVQHAVRSAEILNARGANVGFVLYRRTEGLPAPELRPERLLGRFPAITVGFRFGLAEAEVTAAFRAAIGSVAGPGPLVYHQTSVLLPYAPPEFDTVVTHHAPFVRDVVAAIGRPLAQQAFEWDHQKMDHLLWAQEQGLRVVRDRPGIVCAEISPIQVRRLLAEGVPPDRVVDLPQPLDWRGDLVEPPAALGRLERGPELVAVTAVSRLDQFKNVELFVRGCCVALESGDLGAAAVIGGFPGEAERARLRALVPDRLRDAFVFEPRISHDALRTLFRRLAGKAVFVCSSRFDLVPYTALEAARTGLITMVPDIPSVGAGAYLPARFRFEPDAEGMATCLKRLARDAGALREFEPVGAEIRWATGDDAFLARFAELSRRRS